MWEYHIKTGTLKHNGEFVGTGYSGLAGKWRNNPRYVKEVGKGPIPPGIYAIGAARNSPTLGPCVLNLDPVEETDTYGRSLFRIHGDNARHNASHGCVILGPLIRHAIASSGDNRFKVTE